jgi:hypothetical protein
MGSICRSIRRGIRFKNGGHGGGCTDWEKELHDREREDVIADKAGKLAILKYLAKVPPISKKKFGRRKKRPAPSKQGFA